MKASSKTFLIFFILFYLLWLIRATLFYSAVDLSIPDGTARLVFSNVVKFLLWVVPAAIYVSRLQQENPLVSLKISTPPDRRGVIIGLVISLLYFAGVFTFEKFSSGRTLAPLLQASPAAWLATLAQVWFSPISEEIMFRGFVLPQLTNRMAFWKANLLQAVLFTAMHWPNWIWTGGFGPSILSMSVGVFAIALLLGWLVKRTNSIWPGVVVHIVNNSLVSFLG